MFSPQAIQEANKIIADVYRRFKKEIHVEAYNKVPAAKADEFKHKRKDRAYRDRFFRAWADQRFATTGSNGVFVLMYRESTRGFYVQVVPGRNTAKRALKKTIARPSNRRFCRT